MKQYRALTSDELMLVKLEKLFNKIFKTGYYPNEKI